MGNHTSPYDRRQQVARLKNSYCLDFGFLFKVQNEKLRVRMTGINIIHSLGRIACLSFLAFVCCGHVYLSAHLHHLHVNDSVAFEVSFHHLSPEVAHTSTHHHEDQPSHRDEDEHKYKKKNDWRVSRSKSTANVTLDPPGLPLRSYSLLAEDLHKSRPFLRALFFEKERYNSITVIRGPPRLA